MKKIIAGKIILGAWALTAAMLAPSVQAQEAKSGRAADPRPNIIVIMADDLGVGDVGIYGSDLIRTPEIDKLAKSGILFNQGYVSHPVCAPSRAGLLTGRSQTRFGYEFNPVGRDLKQGMSLTEATIADVVKSAGYKTALIGKWHTGAVSPYRPTDRGFDEFFGITAGGTTYITRPSLGDQFVQVGLSEESARTSESKEQQEAMAKLSGPERLMKMRANYPVQRGNEVVDEPAYLTEAFTREAVSFIDRNKDQPFFLYLAYNAPHTPLQATLKYVARYFYVMDKGKRVYAAMVSALDDGVGGVVNHLKKTGLDKNTLIVFTSDNGCPEYILGACTNGVLAGGKGNHLEGGIRVPFIAAWPGTIEAGRKEDRMVSTLDLFPTLAALSGAKIPEGKKLDGVDLSAMLKNKDTQMAERALYWRAGVNYAIRSGQWKYWIANIAPPRAADDTRAALWVPDGIPAKISPAGQHKMLYDLSSDPGEKKNLAANDAPTADRLDALIREWDKENVDPIWTSQRQADYPHDGKVLELFN